MWYDTGSILVDFEGLFLNLFDELGCREKSVGEVTALWKCQYLNDQLQLPKYQQNLR